MINSSQHERATRQVYISLQEPMSPERPLSVHLEASQEARGRASATNRMAVAEQLRHREKRFVQGSCMAGGA